MKLTSFYNVKTDTMTDKTNIQYIWQKCVICEGITNQVYMANDIPICPIHIDTPEFIEWLRINRPIFYRFEEE